MLGLGALSMAAISANAQMVPLFEEDPQFIASSATDATPGQWDTDMFRGNAMWVDVNNDGQMDLFLVGNTTAAGWHSHLYGWTNNNGTFTEIQNLPFTQRSDGNACPAGDTRGTNNVTLAWIDYNNDVSVEALLTSDDLEGALINSVEYRDDTDILISTDKGIFAYNLHERKLSDRYKSYCRYASVSFADSIGRTWVGTYNGMVCIDDNSGIRLHVTEQDGLPGSVFNKKAVCQLNDGSVILGP